MFMPMQLLHSCRVTQFVVNNRRINLTLFDCRVVLIRSSNFPNIHHVIRKYMNISLIIYGKLFAFTVLFCMKQNKTWSPTSNMHRKLLIYCFP